MIPTVTLPGFDPGVSKVFQRRAEQAVALVEAYNRQAAELDAKIRENAARPLEDYTFGEANEFREAEAATLAAGMKLRKELTGLDVDFRVELGRLYRELQVKAAQTRDDVRKSLARIGFLEPIEGATVQGQYFSTWVEAHPSVRTVTLRTQELLGSMNDLSHAQRLRAEIREIEGRLESLRQRFARV